VDCHETARRFSDVGARVTVFAARHPGSAPATASDGFSRGIGHQGARPSSRVLRTALSSTIPVSP
jgi:hypothetical protein